MDDRAMGHVPNPAGPTPGGGRQPWTQGQPMQPSWSPRDSGIAPTVPNPVMQPMGAPGTGSPETPGWSGQPERPKRRWPRRVLIGAGLVGLFALGSCTGQLGSVAQNTSLRDDLETTTGQLAGMSAERDELSLLVEQQGEDLLAAQEESETLATTLGTAEADLATAQTDLTTAQTDLAASQALVSERDATIASLQAELAAAQAAAAPAIAPFASTPTQPTAAAPSASTYYANCTAVRNAGAAPIRAGQPGYGSHLDRDGDGVGCE